MLVKYFIKGVYYTYKALAFDLMAKEFRFMQVKMQYYSL